MITPIIAIVVAFTILVSMLVLLANKAIKDDRERVEFEILMDETCPHCGQTLTLNHSTSVDKQVADGQLTLSSQVANGQLNIEPK